MPTADEMKVAFERYRAAFNAGDREAYLASLADDPFIDEPAGSGMRHGRQHFAAVIDGIREAGISATIQEPTMIVAGAGNELAVSFVATSSSDAGYSEVPAIEVFTFADDGRIAGMRAFVDPAHLPA